MTAPVTPPASVEPVAWAVVRSNGTLNGPTHDCEHDAAARVARLNSETSRHAECVLKHQPYRVAPLYAADVPALMARIERAEALLNTAFSIAESYYEDDQVGCLCIADCYCRAGRFDKLKAARAALGREGA